MKFINYLLALLVMTGCQQGIKMSKGEEMFLDNLLLRHPELSQGKHLLFITNKSECGPCEEKVQHFYNENFGNTTKTFVTSPNQQYVATYPDTIQFTYRQLASYGLIGATGAVVVINKGECTLSKLISLDHLHNLRTEIYKALSN